MFVADTLLIIGLGTASLGTIQEADGVQEHTFWLRNLGKTPITLQQGYTSCGCTTMRFEKDATVAIGDSTAVTLRFNPQGKGGDFMETGTLIYRPTSENNTPKSLRLTLEGTCISSEETLLRQFPIALNDSTRLSTSGFDIGVMYVGESKDRSVVVLHRSDNDRQEVVTFRFTVTPQMEKGVRRIAFPLHIGEHSFPINLDMRIK